MGGCIVSIQANSAVLDAIRFQSGHLISSAMPTKSLFLVEYLESMPSLPFEIYETRGSIDGATFTAVPELGIMFLSFEKSGNFLVLFRKEHLPDSSDSLRVIYQWIIQDGPVPIHGGSVSWGSKAALISSTGGAGKSSLISASVLAGAKTTGDDFGLLSKRGSDYFAWSQFKSFKLSEDSPTTSLMKTAPFTTSSSGKNIFDFSSIALDPMETSHRLDVILIPQFGASPTFSRVPNAQAIRKIAISSAGMALDKISTINLISSMCRDVPVFNFELSQDSEENTSKLRGFLEA